MKYFIITKKHINILKVAVASVMGVCVICTVLTKLRPKAVQTFSPMEIMKEQLPKEDEKETIGDFAEKIIGFSPFSPESVISDYSSIFEKVEIKKASPPTSEKKEEVQPEETEAPQKTVEEKRIAGSKKIKNQTQYEVSFEEFEKEDLKISTPATVLIVHTHTTESYAPEDKNAYFITNNSRSYEDEKNMIAIGTVIGEELKKQGIEVIHDKTYHDYPIYNGAYGRSLATVKAQQEKNPGINVILDIHRDAIVAADGTETKVMCEIDGEKTAQVMLVVGTNGGGLTHPGWRDNFAFAVKIQKLAEEKYPGLMRPVNLRDERFNQHTTPGSIIIEVGTNANTLEEAKRGAVKIGECIGEILK